MGLLFVTIWRDVCLLSMMVVMFTGSVGDTQDVTLAMIEPDPPFPCPNQSVVYECTVDGYVAIRWILPTDDMTVLAFAGFEDLGSNESNGIFTAFLNRSGVVGTSFSITSTLQIQRLDNLNGSSLTCGGVTSLGDTVDRMITITVSGNPSPPHDLHHDVSANTESSAVIQWQSPLYTGGPINRYTVTANDQTASVSGDVFTYTITGLDVNTDYSVEVTAVNSCGLESEPANVTVNIEARVPPTPALLPTELHCDVPLTDERPVVINWMYGTETKEEGVVYPGEVEVRVDLDPGDMACSGVTADDISCTVNITRDDNYTVSLTLSNDVGSTQPVESMFNSAALFVEYSLSSSDSPRGLRATLNPLCTEPLFVQGLFGVRQAPNKECVYLQSSTQHFTDSNEIFIELDLTLEPAAYEYCAEAILNGRERIIVDDICAEECETADSDDGLSAGAVAGIAFTITLIVSLPVGVVIGLGVSWWVRRHGQGPTSEGSQQKTEQQLQGAIYEEPVETVIPLSDNLAYGHVDLKRKN